LKVVAMLPWGERRGGAERMFWTFLRHLDRRRLDPVVVFLSPGSFRHEVDALGFRTIVLPAGRLRELRSGARTLRALAAVLRRERPDLILSWAAKAHLYAAPAALLAGIGDPIVWWQHGVPKGHWMDRAATLLPARAVGCSSRLAAEAQARLRPRRPTFVVHPGVEPPRTVSGTEIASLRRELRIPKERTVVGLVARLDLSKGQVRFLRAVAELQRRGRDVHGLLVGGRGYGSRPDYERELHRVAETLDLAERITLSGHIPDPAPYYALMDVLASASTDESFGMALLEGMALGIPVVAVAAPGPTEIIEHERSGLLVRSGGEGALADAIDRLLRDEALRVRLSSAARRRCNRFTAQRMEAELLANLESVAGS
jgi:glycosyltransferase involved in cell wall biosynthesis